MINIRDALDFLERAKAAVASETGIEIVSHDAIIKELIAEVERLRSNQDAIMAAWDKDAVEHDARIKALEKLLAHIDTKAAQIEALKEKLVEERAHVLAGRGNLLWEPLPKEDRPDGLYPALTIRGKTYWRNQARQQLAEDEKLKAAGVRWE